LGDNIGTTVTANLAAITASRPAKQAAVAHTLFNVLGVSVMVALFYVPINGMPCFFYAVDRITSGDVFAGENVGRHIAAAHSLFNIVCVVMFTPLIGVLAWVCTKIIPVRVAPRPQLVRLDRSWLATPSLALDGALRATTVITERACWVALTALESYHKGEAVPLAEMEQAEGETDEMQRQIMDYLMLLTRCKLSASQAAAIPALMHCVSDAERIADIGVSIAELIPQACDDDSLTPAAKAELDEILDKTKQLGESVLNGLRGIGKNPIETAVRLEGQVKILSQLGSQGHVVRLQRGECTIERGIVYVEVLSLVEAIVRHLGNIATRTDAAIGDVN
jgi:Na+/phosphate symporter